MKVKTFFLIALTLDELQNEINNLNQDEVTLLSTNANFDGKNYFVMYMKLG